MSHNDPQHVSSSTLLIIRRTNCITTASGIVTLHKQPYSVQVESRIYRKHRIHLSPKEARMSRSQVKTMLVCFFDHKGIVHHEFISQGQMVNQQCYLEELTSLQESVWRKRPGLWPDRWILHHDNAPVHDVLRVREFLAKNSITKMDHPPYSPDLAPCNFWLFPKLKNALKGQRFADLSDMQRDVKTLLRGNCSPLSTCILYGCLQRVTIPEAVVIQLVLLMMSSLLLETC